MAVKKNKSNPTLTSTGHSAHARYAKVRPRGAGMAHFWGWKVATRRADSNASGSQDVDNTHTSGPQTERFI